MKKMILLLVVLIGMPLTLSGCVHWGCGNGHSNGPSQSHSHYDGCGHQGY